MILRLLHKLWTADVMGLILILAALQALIYGISSSLINTDTAYFYWACCLAVLIALGLSKFKFNGIQASIGMVLLGVLGIWILSANLASPLLDLFKAILVILPQIVPSIRAHLPMDTTPIVEAWFLISQASSALSLRVQAWLFSLKGDTAMNDPLVRNMAWTLIMWLIAAWMGWFAAKRNAIGSLLPSIALLAAVTSYSGYRIETLWFMVFILLLLMGIWNYKNHTTQWETKKIDYSDSIQYDVGQAVLLLTVVIGLTALITPSISWREIRDYLRERNQPSNNQAADLLGIRQQPVYKKNVPGPKPSMPRDHLLSGGFAQSEKIVMTIRTGELPPIDTLYVNVNAPRYYWRSVVYDIYVSGGWLTSGTLPQKYNANTPLIPGFLNGYKTLHLNVRMSEPEGKLFWTGVLFSADVPFTAAWRIKPQSNLFADQSALLQSDMFAALSKASAYRAESYVPLASVEELRAASTNYPEEITKRYLSLPGSVPERVIKLAREITKGKTNAYDKAKAIEAYLRTYPYDLKVPAPPEEQDVADYFLFDLKKGYCDYYATAMVVLARANGIPARFVSGYSSGDYDAPNAQYIVRELNAHSWPEIYFPEYGWIEFEPTAAQPEIERPLSKNPIVNKQKPDSAVSQLLYRFRLIKAIYLFSPFVIILFGSVFYFILVERWLYLRLAPAAAIEKIYRRLYRLGRPLAGERTKAETAYEFMQKLINRIDTLHLRGHSHLTKLILSAERDIAFLTRIYQDTLFSDNNIQKKDVRKALNTWKRLRLRLFVARVYVILSRGPELLRAGPAKKPAPARRDSSVAANAPSE